MLSKLDKKHYRSLLFRHIDGISLIGPLSQLNKSNIADFIKSHNSFTLEDIISLKKCNPGYINVTLHLLRCQGWIELKEKKFYKTKNGNKALNLFDFYEQIHKYIDDLIECNNTLFDNTNSNNYLRNILSIIKKYSTEVSECNTSNQIYHHLTGSIIGPVLVAIGMSKYYQSMLNTLNLSIVKEKSSNDTYEYLNELFEHLNWIKNNSFTDEGEFYLKRASAYGVTTSYLPIYSFMDIILFKNVDSIWEKIDNKEQHVNRVMNVWGSGGAHTTYFKKIDEIIINIFNQPIDSQPKGIADMGCGDGTLLIHLYDVIKNKTSRGKILDQHPLFVIGADFNLEAQETSLKNLINADIESIILEADISNPVKFDKILNDKYNLNLNDLLNVRSFLDHNRVYRSPKNNDLKKSNSTGAYSYRGKLIENITLEQNLLEHLKAWKPYINKHGLLILELHCLDPKIISNNIGLTGSAAYESTHGYSDQYIVNLECFLELAKKSGLNSVEEYELKFPDNELSNISINLFK